MPTFRCENKECENYNKPIFLTRLKYYFNEEVGESNPKSSDVLCNKCKQEMVEVKKELKGDISFSYMSFNTKSDSDKRDMLKKRAKDHTEKRMKDSIHSIKKKYGSL